MCSLISAFYVVLCKYLETIYSILNQMIIPHKQVFIGCSEPDYDFKVFSQEPKRANFSNLEKEVLLQLIDNERDAIEDPTVDANSLYKKRQAWDRIGQEFNSYEETTKKTVHQLRTWWSSYKKQTPKIQRKQITYEQIGDANSNNVIICDSSEHKELILVAGQIEKLQERSDDFCTMDKNLKCRKNVQQLYEAQETKVVNELKTHEKKLQDLQLKEIEKRFEIIEEETKLKLGILKLQLKQEQLKTEQAEKDLDVYKQKTAILDLDLRQRKMDVEMKEYLLKEKQLKLSCKHNSSKHSTA